MQQQRSKFEVIVTLFGTAITLPVNKARLPFAPSSLIVNNQTALNIQVGPSVSGPFQNVRQYVLATLPWRGEQSLYIQQNGTGSAISTDFLEVDALQSPFGGGNQDASFQSYAPGGWGNGGPGNSLSNVNPGDPFRYGQIQQLINLLTGVMTGQAVTLASTALVKGNFEADNSSVLKGLVQVIKDGSNVAQLELQSEDATVMTLTWFTLVGIIHAQVTNALGSSDVLRMARSGSSPQIGFLGAAPASRQTVSGSQGGNAALASLLSALAAYGLLTDSSAAGDLVMTNRLQEAHGANVTAATDLTLGDDGNFFVITGSTTIDHIDRTNWQDGSMITLRMSGAKTLRNNIATSGNNYRLGLAGATNYAAPDNAVITFRLDVGQNIWWEQSRSQD